MNYKDKYLKYKNKYLNLKKISDNTIPNNMSGGAFQINLTGIAGLTQQIINTLTPHVQQYNRSRRTALMGIVKLSGNTPGGIPNYKKQRIVSDATTRPQRIDLSAHNITDNILNILFSPPLNDLFRSLTGLYLGINQIVDIRPLAGLLV